MWLGAARLSAESLAKSPSYSKKLRPPQQLKQLQLQQRQQPPQLPQQPLQQLLLRLPQPRPQHQHQLQLLLSLQLQQQQLLLLQLQLLQLQLLLMSSSFCCSCTFTAPACAPRATVAAKRLHDPTFYHLMMLYLHNTSQLLIPNLPSLQQKQQRRLQTQPQPLLEPLEELTQQQPHPTSTATLNFITYTINTTVSNLQTQSRLY